MSAESALSDDVVARFRARAAETALCIDFDGTLAPIVDDPTTARPLDGVVASLARLARGYAAVALVSGLPAAFLAERAPAHGVRYLGLYGLEESLDGTTTVDPRIAALQPAVDAAKDDVRAASAIVACDAYVEDKGSGVAVHLRRVADPARWTAAVDAEVRAIAARRGLELVPGKLVWELRPNVRADKGDAVRRVVAESGARGLVVIGDDLGDIPAFVAARALAERGADVLCVGVRSDEMPEDLRNAADVVVDGPDGVRAMLSRMESPDERIR